MLNPTLTFAAALDQIKSDSANLTMLDSYKEIYGSLPENIQEMPFWKYLCEFEPITYRATEKFTDFERDVFLRLTISSLSSDYDLELNDNEDLVPDLILKVSSRNLFRSDNVNELFDFQTGKIYMIYVREQIQLSIVMNDHSEREAILEMRSDRIKKWKAKREILLNQIEKEAAKRRRNSLLL